MKKAVLFLGTLFAVNVATAATSREVWHCLAQLPKGTATVVVDKVDNVEVSYKISLTNDYSKETYSGTLKVTGRAEGSGFVYADGALSTPEGLTKVNLTGDSKPHRESGHLWISLYGTRGSDNRIDHRIEHGYGNHLTCTAVN